MTVRDNGRRDEMQPTWPGRLPRAVSTNMDKQKYYIIIFNYIYCIYSSELVAFSGRLFTPSIYYSFAFSFAAQHNTTRSATAHPVPSPPLSLHPILPFLFPSLFLFTLFFPIRKICIRFSPQRVTILSHIFPPEAIISISVHSLIYPLIMYNLHTYLPHTPTHP